MNKDRTLGTLIEIGICHGLGMNRKDSIIYNYNIYDAHTMTKLSGYTVLEIEAPSNESQRRFIHEIGRNVLDRFFLLIHTTFHHHVQPTLIEQ